LKHNTTVNEIDTSNIINTITNTSGNNINKQNQDDLSNILRRVKLKSNIDKGVKE
jgi:hypothetical protein